MGKLEPLDILGNRNGKGTFDTFYNTEKYKSVEDAINANDAVIADFVKEDGIVYFQLYHLKEPNGVIHERLQIQHFPAGIDMMDDSRACEIGYGLLRKHEA